jgi:hypothetical protein
MTALAAPPTRYARSGEARIAFQVMGDGPPDLVVIGGPASHLDLQFPDLSQALRQAPPALKRQVFEAFCLEVRYDKIERRIEISATISQAVADGFENAKDLPAGGLSRHSQGHSAGPIRPSGRRTDRGKDADGEHIALASFP